MKVQFTAELTPDLISELVERGVITRVSVLPDENQKPELDDLLSLSFLGLKGVDMTSSKIKEALSLKNTLREINDAMLRIGFKSIVKRFPYDKNSYRVFAR